MNKKIFKRAVAMMMAAVLTVGAALPSSNVFASGSDEEKDTKTLAVYDADVRTDLDEDEVVTAGDIVIAAGYGFDIENDMEGIVYEQEKVAVSYYPDQGSFDADFRVCSSGDALDAVGKPDQHAYEQYCVL